MEVNIVTGTGASARTSLELVIHFHRFEIQQQNTNAMFGVFSDFIVKIEASYVRHNLSTLAAKNNLEFHVTRRHESEFKMSNKQDYNASPQHIFNRQSLGMQILYLYSYLHHPYVQILIALPVF